MTEPIQREPPPGCRRAPSCRSTSWGPTSWTSGCRPPHAVATGDLFRRLRLTIRSDGAAPTHRYFGRRFRRRFDGVVDRLEPVADTRLHMARKRITVPVGAATARWELVLERVASAPSTDPADDVVEGATPVATGCIDRQGAACDP